MRGRVFAGFVVAFALLVTIPIAAAPVGAASSGVAHTPANKDQCKNGGWRSLAGGQGVPFRNQGQCATWAIHHPVTLADLAGSFTGTTVLTPFNGCSFIEEVFDATYVGSGSVGTVTLHIDGCINFEGITASTYTGTFTSATSAGTLSGTASGSISNLLVPPLDFELSLTVTSGTGAFTATTGTMHVSVSVPTGPIRLPIPVTGSLTVP